MDVNNFKEGGFLLVDLDHPECQWYHKRHMNFTRGRAYLIQDLRIGDEHYFALISDDNGNFVNWPIKWSIPVVQEATQEEMDQLIG
jgi:hypothetical protein